MKGKSYRNTAFLIELLINVVVLSVSCAILVGVFVEAWLGVRNTGRTNAAANEVNALLQTAKVRGFDSLEAEATPGGTLVLYYTEDWAQATEANATFVVELTVEPQVTGAGSLEHIVATARALDGGELCSFTTAIYRPDTQGGGA